ncbi:heavy metal translocating P-type ATPase [Bdellovibrionota bacterium FG-2]
MTDRTLSSPVYPAEVCFHCGTPVPLGKRVLAESETRALLVFCCQGCRSVFQILSTRGLDAYYEIKKKAGSFRPAIPVGGSSHGDDYLDDPEFARHYVTQDQQMQFYLEGIHCAACVWLIEKVPDFVPGVMSVRLEVGRSVVSVQAQKGFSWAAVARQFREFGYAPHPIREGEGAQFQALENRSLLIKVGVAGACTGNIMLLAVALYGGATGALAAWFRWISFFLFLPVLCWSAIPFYRSTYSNLRMKSVSVDVPIVIGIVFGFIASVVNLFQGSVHIYFDSLSALVFLLLASRYVLRRTGQNALRSSSLAHFMGPSVARRFCGAGISDFQEVGVEVLKTGDEVDVRVGETIPVDGTVLQGVSRINCALLTGESDPQAATPGDGVFAGTLNEQAPLRIRVTASGSATRVGQILRTIQQGSVKKTQIVQLTDRVSRYFVAGVLGGGLLSFLVFVGFLHLGIEEALNRTLALVIVSCPCALALATPLALTRAMGQAARRGILIKNAEVIEKMTAVRKVFSDKTGTLTVGQYEVLSWEWETEENIEDVREISLAVLELEKRSSHPIAKAIVRYLLLQDLGESGDIDIIDFQERLGKGVCGRSRDHAYELHAVTGLDNGEQNTCVGVYRDGILCAKVELGDPIRDDSRQAIRRLLRLGLPVAILSGDSPSVVQSVARGVGVSDQKAVGGLGPEQKQKRVLESPFSLMVGDGANDAQALSAAYVGVAVHGGMEISLRVADVYLARAGLGPLLELFDLSFLTMKVIRRNLVFSLMYNVLGISFALTGQVTPLFAAVLMPLSALTVFVSSFVGRTGSRRRIE